MLQQSSVDELYQKVKMKKGYQGFLSTIYKKDN